MRPNGSIFQAGQHGGFAYIFEDISRNRFFPIIGNGEMIDRACVPSGMNATCLDANPTGDQLLKSILLTLFLLIGQHSINVST